MDNRITQPGFFKNKLISPSCFSTLLNEENAVKVRDSEGNTLLLIALGAYQNQSIAFRLLPDLSIAYQLIEKGADINAANKKGQTPLMLAINYKCNGWIGRRWENYSDYIQMVEYLISHGANVNLSSKNGWTALIYAAAFGALDAVKLLIKNHAEVNVFDNYYRNSPLLWSIENDYLDIAEFLIQSNAEVNWQNKEGDTALTKAIGLSSEKIIKQLLAAGADANIKNSRGNTPLHYAAYHGCYEIAELLIKSGAKIKLINQEGHTPLDWIADSCSSHNKLKIAYLIRSNDTSTTKSSQSCLYPTLFNQIGLFTTLMNGVAIATGIDYNYRLKK